MFRFTLLVLFLATPFASAQSPKGYEPLHDRFAKFVADGESPGAVIVVGNKSGALFTDAVGMADIEAKKPMKTDTVFRIASMTKPITSLGIMILVDEGKLSPDDLVEKHLPEFKGQLMVSAKDKDTTTLKKPMRPIEIRDLLTHTSGMVGNYPPGFADVYVKRNRTLNETTIAVSQLPLQFEPGSKWSYCNPGIDTLGRIIEVASGKKYEDFLQERIFTPLGMKDTSFFPNADQLKRTAITYGMKNKEFVPIANTLLDLGAARKHPVPAGGLYSTAADLSLLYTMMLHKGEGNGKRIVSEKSVVTMTTTQTGDIKTGFVDGSSFGFGWAVVKEPKGVTEMLSAGSFGHGGAFGTQGWIDPKQNLFFILLIQQSGSFGGDASIYRKELQRLGVEASKQK